MIKGNIWQILKKQNAPLDVYNNETTNGKPMTISWYNGSVAQKFRMVLQASAIQPPNGNPLFPILAGF